MNVVAPSPPSSGASSGGARGDRRGDGEEEENAEMVMMEEEEEEMSTGARLGGWFDDGQHVSRRERTRAIRREEKEGKNAEKVH